MIRSPALRGLVRWMSAGATPAPRWREHAQILIRARLIVQAYYLIALYSLVGFVQRLQKSAIADAEAFLPQWPVAWMAWHGLPLSAYLLIPLAILSGNLGVIWWRRFWVRALVALLLLQLVAFASSWGGVSHGYHTWNWSPF